MRKPVKILLLVLSVWPFIYGIFFFFAFALPLSVQAQDTHVHTSYAKETNTTMVETDLMYLINTPQQFIQFGLIARHPNQQLQKPPKKVDLLIWSSSKDVMYRADKDHTIIINTDGAEWSVTPQLYAVFKGETKNGQDLFWNEKRPIIGEPSPFPANMQVKAQGSVTGLYMEQIFADLKPEQLQKIANAKKVKLQLGSIRIELSDEYMSTIRDFYNRLFPNAQSPAAQPPSGQAGTPVNIGVVNGKAKSLPQPEYPALARGARAAGSVNVFVTIDETGKVIAARAITGHPLLREAAEAAAMRAKFTPTMISGQAVQVTGFIIYNFVP